MTYYALCFPWLLAFPFIIVGGIIYLVRRLRNPSLAKWDRSLGCLTIAYLVVPFGIVCGSMAYELYVIAPPQNEQIHRDLTLMIEKLDEFKRREGHYPEVIHELSPTYLAAIPVHPAEFGLGYTYEKEGDEYSIMYRPPISVLTVFIVCVYRSENRKTICRD